MLRIALCQTKAIDLVDEAGARVRLYKVPFASELEKEVSELGIDEEETILSDPLGASFDGEDNDEEDTSEKPKVMEEDIA